MAVSASVDLAEARYRDFFQEIRGGHDGRSPVGTLHAQATVTGAAGGGSVVHTYTGQRIMYGFRAILAPTLILADDNQASPTTIRLAFSEVANNRLAGQMDQVQLAVAGNGGNFAKFDESGIIVQSDVIATGASLIFVWSTNTDTKVYNSGIFFSVFDAELIEKHGSVSDFLAGVR